MTLAEDVDRVRDLEMALIAFDFAFLPQALEPAASSKLLLLVFMCNNDSEEKEDEETEEDDE